MAMGEKRTRQGSMWISTDDLTVGPGYPILRTLEPAAVRAWRRCLCLGARPELLRGQDGTAGHRRHDAGSQRGDKEHRARDTGESYGESLPCLAEESGEPTPTHTELARRDRKRNGKARTTIGHILMIMTRRSPG
jgi:hypothetical protein